MEYRASTRTIVFAAAALCMPVATQAFDDAKYPDLNSVDGICRLNRDSLATDIAGSEDFTKRFTTLKA